MTGTLNISRTSTGTRVLGPGLRAVVWVHGCPLRCRGCVAPEDLPFEGGLVRPVEELAAELNALPAEVTGVTFSGGEPMAQAGGLAALTDLLRAGRDWSVMSYSGYTLEHLRGHGTPDQHALLDRLDILVDGPYLEHRHADLRWRGSANQRVRLLTGRHRLTGPDRSAGLELGVCDTTLTWTGVPAAPGFRAAFEAAMRTAGVTLTPETPEPPNPLQTEGTTDVG